MSQPVNCYADFTFGVDVNMKDAATLIERPATAGEVTNIKLRLAATKHGTAIHSDVNALAASECSGMPARFAVPMDAAVLTAHVLPLGVGRPFYAIWSKTGDLDFAWEEFRVASDVRVT